MVIVEDTRQQKERHALKNEYFKANDVDVIRSKLFVGDYTRLDNQTIAVDTKKDVVELSMDLTRDHERFRAECERAQKYGIKLYVLVEEDCNDLDLWKSPKKKNGKPYTVFPGKTLKKICKTMTERYDVEFVFCAKKDAGQNVLKLLFSEESNEIPKTKTN